MAEFGGNVTSESAPVVAERAFSSSADTPHDWRISALFLGRIGLAVLLYGLIMDAAFETILSGSAVRWLTTGTVAAYAAVTVLLWRRLEWRTKTTASYLVLLVLFLLTAWPDQGLRDGIHLLGQPTTVVLAGGSALAVLFSAAILVRQPNLPRVARGVTCSHRVACAIPPRGGRTSCARSGLGQWSVERLRLWSH